MAATLIDEVLEPVEQDNLDEVEELTEETEVVEEEEEELPEKYKGKSLKDIVEMHREAEKLLGRQSSEVGELRKVVDTYIQSQVAPKETEEEVDFFDDPQTAINNAIEKHPKIREAEEISNQYRKNDTLVRLKAKYGDLEEIVQDPNFAEWVKSSRIRTQLYVMADQQSDFDAADELLGNWVERKSIASQTAELEKKSRKESVKKASTGNVRGTGESSRKTYRRSDIIRLMKEDPDRYAAMSDEIMKAYQEGRVK